MIKNLIFIFLTVLISTAANAGEVAAVDDVVKALLVEKPLPAFTKGKLVSIVAHNKCNEIELIDNVDKPWTLLNQGGAQSKEDLIDENEIRRVSLGIDADGKKSETIFRLNGKDFEDDWLESKVKYSRKYYALGKISQGYMGRFIGLLDQPTDENLITDEKGEKRQRIGLAVIYLNHEPGKAPPKVQCTYISNDLPVDELESKDPKCFWLDGESRGSNGKPYCW